MFRYTVLGATGSASRVAFARFSQRQLAPGEREVRFRGTRSQSFTFRPDGRIDRAAGAALLTLDRAEGADAPPEVAGGEFGNVLEVRARAAGGATSAEQIYVSQGIERLERFANSADSSLRDPGRGRRLRIGLPGVGRIVARATALAAIVDFFVGADSISCTSSSQFNAFNRRASRTFAASGDALSRSGAASLGGSSRARQLVLSAIRRVRSLNRNAGSVRRLYDDGDCAAGARYALKVTSELGPTLKSAESCTAGVGHPRDRW